jgi:hypothetical protein
VVTPGRSRYNPRLLAGLLLPALLLSYSCTSTETPEGDGGARDLGPGDAVRPPDLSVAADAGTGNIGSPCDPDTGQGCTGGATCLKIGHQAAVCTISGCTLENIATPGTEDTCPTITPRSGPSFRTVCTRVPIAGGTFCLPACTPSTTQNPCKVFHSGPYKARSRPLSCDPASIIYNDHSEVCLLPGCLQDTDCWQNALMRDQICHKPTGTCQTVGQAGVKVGAPCKVSTDCGPSQFCYPERKESGGRTLVEGGYCTVVGCNYGEADNKTSIWDCPAESRCFTMGSLNALSMCLATGCSPEKPPESDGCRDKASAGQYDCIYIEKVAVCWLAPSAKNN